MPLDCSSLPLSYETLTAMIPEETKTYHVSKRNSACGDKLDLQIKVLAGTLISVVFEGHACVLCKEQAKLLSTFLSGCNVETLTQIRFEPDFEVKPGRVNCYELPYKCLEAADEWAREENTTGDQVDDGGKRVDSQGDSR